MSKPKGKPAGCDLARLVPGEDAVSLQAFKDDVRPQARKAEQEKFDLRRKTIFLQTLRRTCNVTQSAKAAGIDPATAYRHRARYPQFDLAWLDAQAHAVDLLETLMVERALRYNAALSEGGRDDGADAGKVEPFSNGDAMRLIKLHRESITARRVEIAARLRQSPSATYERLSEKLEEIYQRIMARDEVLNDAPV